MEDTRVQILKFIEKNCKVDPKELAVLTWNRRSHCPS